MSTNHRPIYLDLMYNYGIRLGLYDTFYECDAHMWRLGPRILPHQIEISTGSNWIGLNKEFVSYLVNGDDELINGMRTTWNYTIMAVESYFHTLLKTQSIV